MYIFASTHVCSEAKGATCEEQSVLTIEAKIYGVDRYVSIQGDGCLDGQLEVCVRTCATEGVACTAGDWGW